MALRVGQGDFKFRREGKVICLDMGTAKVREAKTATLDELGCDGACFYDGNGRGPLKRRRQRSRRTTNGAVPRTRNPLETRANKSM